MVWPTVGSRTATEQKQNHCTHIYELANSWEENVETAARDKTQRARMESGLYMQSVDKRTSFGLTMIEMKWPDGSAYFRVVNGSVFVTRSNPTHQLVDSTQANPIRGKKWTQPNTTNKGAYSLVVTYFYKQNLSRTFSQPSVKLFMFFTDRDLNALT